MRKSNWIISTVIGKMVGGPSGWWPLKDQPHVHLIQWVFIGCPLPKGSNRGVRQLGYHPKGTTIFPMTQVMVKIKNTSGQISIIPKPALRGFWGSSLIKPPFRVTTRRENVVIICPDLKPLRLPPLNPTFPDFPIFNTSRE